MKQFLIAQIHPSCHCIIRYMATTVVYNALYCTLIFVQNPIGKGIDNLWIIDNTEFIALYQWMLQCNSFVSSDAKSSFSSYITHSSCSFSSKYTIKCASIDKEFLSCTIYHLGLRPRWHIMHLRNSKAVDAHITVYSTQEHAL